MTENDEENALTIRDNVIEEQSEMIAELARNLEMVQEEINRTRDLAHLAITVNAPTPGEHETPFQIPSLSMPILGDQPNNISSIFAPPLVQNTNCENNPDAYHPQNPSLTPQNPSPNPFPNPQNPFVNQQNSCPNPQDSLPNPQNPSLNLPSNLSLNPPNSFPNLQNPSQMPPNYLQIPQKLPKFQNVLPTYQPTFFHPQNQASLPSPPHAIISPNIYNALPNPEMDHYEEKKKE
ncbi:hypothetical protein FXO37_28424 [Capsicum annuum]|nr:hypothetical protein FXO37_28424 [Capsicum annuum]